MSRRQVDLSPTLTLVLGRSIADKQFTAAAGRRAQTAVPSRGTVLGPRFPTIAPHDVKGGVLLLNDPFIRNLLKSEDNQAGMEDSDPQQDEKRERPQAHKVPQSAESYRMVDACDDICESPTRDNAA
ncbi:hypothetical protein IW261DRAFT_1416983 [Armillaria novae-zelandiae]|uniref:Uncharacterized protein n=1 Tax=Armillaria novae-zelandiae TaxID=153914 RepID=A0AA39TF57_9AGAR|nr:hypothetical protein IW261DRAFT_1416983 [Armillaria novae-zelandiae]